MPALQKRDKMMTFVTETPHQSYDRIVFQQRGPVVNVVGMINTVDGEQPAFTKKINVAGNLRFDEARVSTNNFVLVADIPREGYTREDIETAFSDQPVNSDVDVDDDVGDGNPTPDNVETIQYTVKYLNENDEQKKIVLAAVSVDAAKELFDSVTGDNIDTDDIVEVVETENVEQDADDFIEVGSEDEDNDGDDDDDDDDGVGDSGKIER